LPPWVPNVALEPTSGLSERVCPLSEPLDYSRRGA
jgi:hypothetical protein